MLFSLSCNTSISVEWMSETFKLDASSMWEFWNSPSNCRKLFIYLSSPNTCQNLMLSGIDGWCLTWMEYFWLEWIRIFTILAVVASELAMTFWALGIRDKVYHEKGFEDVNIGTTDNPKMVNLSKSLSPETKSKFMSFMKEFSNVFSSDNSDLKVYDKHIIQHTIPIGPDQKPFHQKLRRINPKLLPSI